MRQVPPLQASAVMFFTILAPGWAVACPDGYSSGFPGVCYPNVGGDVGRAWEKGKDELRNFEEDLRTWVETGNCGGDICDAFAAAVDFTKANIEDIGPTLENAASRFAEGKPIDALWHLATDPIKNQSKNAAAAAQRSRVLAATGQVAATAYGGPGGAAAYTAWLTYETTGNIGDAIRAGAIAGATSAAIAEINTIDLSGAEGVAVRTAMTGAVSGAAVALAGGDEEAIRTAMGVGMTAALIREGYRELTKLDIDRERLRSSTGEAYCLQRIPLPEDFADPTSCVGPRAAYSFEADEETIRLAPDGKTPVINFQKLDPNRPHVGIWADGTEGRYNVVTENSTFMTGVSRVPGWNAMAVGHDQLAINLELDLIPIAGDAVSIGTIPPAIVLTYLGSGMGVQDAIRETFLQKNVSSSEETILPDIEPAPSDSIAQMAPQGKSQKEVLHLLCEPTPTASVYQERTDILVEVYLGEEGNSDGSRRICDVRQRNGGLWFELGHAHYERNYCHSIAEKIAISRQRDGHKCYGSMGIQSNNISSAPDTLVSSALLMGNN